MPLSPPLIRQYHVFLASPGDVDAERKYVRKFFEDYNRHTAHIWNARFEVIDWENYATTGVGRPQELITRDTLEKYRDSLVLVVGVMNQRFGSPSGKAESGTEEEFKWAMQSHKERSFPEIKWFFRKIDKLEMSADEEEAEKALVQWKAVKAFRKQMQDLKDAVFYTEYPGPNGFGEVFERDLNQWLAAPTRPWSAELGRQGVTSAIVGGALPAEFDSDRYRELLLKRFDKLNFEMLDTTGAYYSGVRLWSVFVPQSVRECNQYNPRLLEIPKEHQQRLLKSGELSDAELKEAEKQAEQLRQEYFSQPLRPVLDVIDGALQARGAGNAAKLVILGDPGSGKSSLIHYLALRWARIAERSVRETQPIPLVIDLGKYARWQCDGRKGFVRFLEEAPVWHDWRRGLLSRLLADSGRVILLLDGLDEIFDVKTREGVVNDIQRFSSEFGLAPVLMTSRVVGYQAQVLRDADFRHFMLQDLDAVQIDGFVKLWHAETFENDEQAAPKQERLLRAIQNSKSIAMLAGNPLLLTMMAILNRNQELPRDRAELYAQASRVLLHQWDTERALVDFPGIRSDIGLREKTEMLRRVAAHMQTDPGGLKGNLVDGATLTGLIESYLREELHFDQGRAAAATLVEQLRLRNFIVCFIGADSYAFVHRTFLEYFCAADIVQRFNVSKSLSDDGLVGVFKEHCGQDEWREVLRLICGQIGEQVVATIIGSLLDEVDLEAWDGHDYLYELGLALAVTTEVRNPSALGNVAARLLDLVLLVLARAGGPSQTESMIKQMQEIADAAEVIGARWPGLKERLPLSTPEFGWARLGGGMIVWPRVAVAFQATDREAGLREFIINGSDAQFRAGAIKALAEGWPDDSTRVLVTQRAVDDESEFPRRVAIEALVEKWPDDSTCALLMQRTVEDRHWHPRQSALEALVEKWPSESTRALVMHRAFEDHESQLRDSAVEALAEKWPDDSTRALLTQRAVDDHSEDVRRSALKFLAEKWPDNPTRALLMQRAVDDHNDDVRRSALEDLGENWRDDSTRALLMQQAVEDHDWHPRLSALRNLAETWPDESTRALLMQRAVEDHDWHPRQNMLRNLAEKWPDQSTRALLMQRAVEDHDSYPRRVALQALAQKWPDESTRAVLTQRAVDDDMEDVRVAALEALVENFPDESTRALLMRRAVDDGTDGVRIAALGALAQNWPDESTRSFLGKKIVEDPTAAARGAAGSASGALHSEFGRILWTHDLDGRAPFLDPLEPIPRTQIDKAARKAQIRIDDIEPAVKSLSAYLGWDVSRGAKALQSKNSRGKPPRNNRKKKK